ncbi:MAG: replication-associated recombination protein A [Anaerolineae bacterium]|nr:replication-associated recombination protein A [Anaerolineae bacterium]
MPESHTQQPLADRIRPQTLEEFVGQEHLVGKGKPLYQALQTGELHSMIFWGPPGVGKTTLARILANQTNRRFFQLSAVSAGKSEVRAIIEQARARTSAQPGLFDEPDEDNRGAVLFLDEIHRFNKAQQDFLLPYVEDGTIVLIGATTENPSFEVIAALLSRAQVFVLEPLRAEDIKRILEHGAAEMGVSVDEDAQDFLAEFASGDARQSLNLLEATSRLYPDGHLTLANLKDTLQSKHLRYDKAGEEHYNTISAFIKSMRASDPDAALYYLARMVNAGEDPLFIARRMVIFASEDIGMAQPTALVVANEVFKACETIGYPECQINLAHGTAYLALAPKDRTSCDGYFKALEDVQRTGNLEIPMKLRNAPTHLMKELGYGQGDGEESNLPRELKHKRYYVKG